MQRRAPPREKTSINLINKERRVEIGGWHSLFSDMFGGIFGNSGLHIFCLLRFMCFCPLGERNYNERRKNALGSTQSTPLTVRRQKIPPNCIGGLSTNRIICADAESVEVKVIDFLPHAWACSVEWTGCFAFTAIWLKCTVKVFCRGRMQKVT